MKIKLIGFLDFFLFKKDLKKYFNMGFLKYIFSLILGEYIFFVNTDAHVSMLWRTKKNNEEKFEIYNVYNLNKKIYGNLLFDEFDSSQFIYIANEVINDIEYLGFKESSCDLFMKIDLKSITFDENIFSDFKFEELENGKNDEERCNIQNEAFYSENRMPVKIKDIKYEMGRKCFIKELSHFLISENIYIAYGQIMLLDDKYTIANLCVKNDFQSKGYGKLLMKYLMLSAKKININDLYIKVSGKNSRAFNLYKNLGFEIVEKIYVYTI